MSRDTYVILIHGHGETGANEFSRDFPIVEKLNGELKGGGFTRLEPFLAPTYGALFKHLDEQVLLRTIREAPWEEPDQVQLFVRREEEMRFTEVDLFDLFQPTRMHKMAAGRAMQLAGPAEQQAFLEALPAALEACRQMVRRIAANPLRSPPYRPTAIEARTRSPWAFEVLEIRPEVTIEEGGAPRDAAGNVVPGPFTYRTLHSFIATLAYHGHAVELWCASDDIGDELYGQLLDAMRGVDVGDVVEILGTVTVSDDGIWRVHHPAEIRKLAGTGSQQL